MHRGNMLCGVHKSKDGKRDMAMFRVGPDQYTVALEIDGVNEMTFTNRPMKGFVECDENILGDDEARRQVLKLALKYTSGLPAK